MNDMVRCVDLEGKPLYFRRRDVLAIWARGNRPGTAVTLAVGGTMDGLVVEVVVSETPDELMERLLEGKQRPAEPEEAWREKVRVVLQTAYDVSAVGVVGVTQRTLLVRIAEALGVRIDWHHGPAPEPEGGT